MKAKKSLGQNFFINKNLGEKIIDLIPSNETVIEIGPGQGFFTEMLQKKSKDLYLIEKDSELVQSLKIQFPKTEIFEDDFLSFDLNKLPTKNIIFFGSLPYNVSKPIIKKIVESNFFNKPAFFIVQKEVAEKYLYQKPYNILSLNTALYAKTKKIIDIKPDSFRPKPKVTSSLILLEPKNIYFDNKDKLKDVIQRSFRYPRKNLKNNLKNTPYEENIQDLADKRASDLSLEEFLQIVS